MEDNSLYNLIASVVINSNNNDNNNNGDQK